MGGGDKQEYRQYVDTLIHNKNMEYIERKEYWGEIPALINLEKLDLPDTCSAGSIVEDFMMNIPENKWEGLTGAENIYIRTSLPYYQSINQCLLSYNTQLVNINFGNDNDFIIAIPTKNHQNWLPWEAAMDQGKIKLSFYSPFNEDQVIQNIKENLPSLVD